MLAVRGKPCKCYQVPFTGFYRVNIPHRLAVMLCACIFGKSYEYRKKYNAYKKARMAEEKKKKAK